MPIWKSSSPGSQWRYRQVPFQRTADGNGSKITGVIPVTPSDFKIDPPSLLTFAIKNEIPVRVEITWRPM